VNFDRIKEWKLVRWLLSRDEQKEKAQTTEFLPAVMEITERPPSPVGRILLWIMLALVGIALLWAIFGHVDEVAVATGKIIPVGQVKVVQAEDKGVVKAIHVKDGQRVKQGELLIELDQTISAAEMARLKKEVAYYELDIARLHAEQSAVPFAPKPSADLDPKEVSFQLQLYTTRMGEYRAKIAAAQAAVEQQQAALISGEAQLIKYRDLLVISRDQEARMESLLAQNAVALFQVLQYRSSRIQVESNLASQTAEVERLRATLAQSSQQLISVTAERDRDIATKMVEDRKQLGAYQEELKKAEEKNRLAKLVAPVDGRVGQLSVYTVGGVVTAAQSLMTIVPDDVRLEVEAWVSNKDIGFVQAGQKAEVKVETFNFQKFGTVDAVVAEISPDAAKQSDKDTELKYRVLLKIDKESIRVSGRDAALAPGMSVTAEIKIRQKRIIEFFLDPFKKYTSEALRER
jgi:hemolysin D